MVPTMRVRRADGHEVTINVSDFDASQHVDLSAKPPAAAPGEADAEQPPADASAASIVEMTAPEAAAWIATIDTLDALVAADEAERQHPAYEGGRKRVLKALEERLAALKE